MFLAYLVPLYLGRNFCRLVLAWSKDGQKLAAGGQNGELIIWSESKRGKGFG